MRHLGPSRGHHVHERADHGHVLLNQCGVDVLVGFLVLHRRPVGLDEHVVSRELMAILAKRLRQVLASELLDVGTAGHTNLSRVVEVQVHVQEGVRVIVDGQLEHGAKQIEFFITTLSRSVEDPRVVHVNAHVDASAVVVDLVVVARVVAQEAAQAWLEAHSGARGGGGHRVGGDGAPTPGLSRKEKRKLRQEERRKEKSARVASGGVGDGDAGDHGRHGGGGAGGSGAPGGGEARGAVALAALEPPAAEAREAAAGAGAGEVRRSNPGT